VNGCRQRPGIPGIVGVQGISTNGYGVAGRSGASPSQPAVMAFNALDHVLADAMTAGDASAEPLCASNAAPRVNSAASKAASITYSSFSSCS
jgi:hypothetical protein